MIDDGGRPLVTVVIPCHNQARHLVEAARSTSARGVRVEVIVVDDGSTDDSAAVARTLSDVRLLRQDRDGLAAARNRGLRAASGDFVIFLDADDRLLPGAIDLGARVLAARPDCAMAYGRSMTIDADGRAWPAADVPTVRSGHHAALLQTNFIWMPGTVIFRRGAVLAAGGFGEGLDGAADYDLYLRISRAHVVHDHGTVVAACRREMRQTGATAARMLRDTLTAMQRNQPAPGSELYRAWLDGYARWQDLYGTQLVEEIRRHLRGRALADVCVKTIALARLAPGVMLRELRRAGRRRYARRALPAEIPSPRRRLET